MRSRFLTLTLASVAALTACAQPPFVLHPRTVSTDELGARVKVEGTVEWAPERTALIVCDMWDDHWCAGAAARVAELAGPMNDLLALARERGSLIVHAPSSVVGFYEGHPARERAREAPFAPTPIALSSDERWGTEWCWPPETEPPLPIDDSDMGCDCHEECTIREAWTRQIATLDIEDEDVITDDAQELHNVLEARGIEHLMILGVHLNMCVLGRPFGIRQMVALGRDIVLVRDMTDTMYDHRMPPHVDHFVGTELVVEHVERHWCPTIPSSDLTGGPPFRFQEAPAATVIESESGTSERVLEAEPGPGSTFDVYR